MSTHVAAPRAGTPSAATATATGAVGGPGGVQSLHRALDVVEAVAALTRGGAGAEGRGCALAEIAEATGLPAPTIHRLAGTLVERGYLRRLADRRYGLGFRLVPLGATAQQQVGAEAHHVLADLVTELGESANLAVLAGHQAEYVAQAPARYAMRMFTEVGRRVDLHSTGVGKALLAQLDDDAVVEAVRRAGMTRQTEHTLTTPEDLLERLREVRSRGYALDEQEQELGVRCVAVALAPPGLGMAVSVSGPLTRMGDDVVARAVPLLQAAADRLAATLDPTAGT